MKITLTEQEMYSINRKLVGIRTKLKLFESELVYMPIKEISDFMERINKYTKMTAQLSNEITETINLLTQHQKSSELF